MGKIQSKNEKRFPRAQDAKAKDAPNAPDNTKASECRRLAQVATQKQRENPYFGDYGRAAELYLAAAGQYAKGYVDAGDVAKREADAFVKSAERSIAKRGHGGF